MLTASLANTYASESYSTPPMVVSERKSKYPRGNVTLGFILTGPPPRQSWRAWRGWRSFLATFPQLHYQFPPPRLPPAPPPPEFFCRATDQRCLTGCVFAGNTTGIVMNSFARFGSRYRRLRLVLGDNAYLKYMDTIVRRHIAFVNWP